MQPKHETLDREHPHRSFSTYERRLKPASAAITQIRSSRTNTTMAALYARVARSDRKPNGVCPPRHVGFAFVPESDINGTVDPRTIPKPPTFNSWSEQQTSS